MVATFKEFIKNVRGEGWIFDKLINKNSPMAVTEGELKADDIWVDRLMSVLSGIEWARIPGRHKNKKIKNMLIQMLWYAN